MRVSSELLLGWMNFVCLDTTKGTPNARKPGSSSQPKKVLRILPHIRNNKCGGKQERVGQKEPTTSLTQPQPSNKHRQITRQ